VQPGSSANDVRERLAGPLAREGIAGTDTPPGAEPAAREISRAHTPPADTPQAREVIEFPPFDVEHLENSLRHLAVLATA